MHFYICFLISKCMEYLEFELPIKELEDQLQKCQIIGDESQVDVTEACKQIQEKLEKQM